MKIALFANTDWYLYNFRQSLAHELRDLGHDVVLISPAGPFGDRLRGMGFRWVSAPMERRSLNPVKEAALVWWLRGLLVREQVDIIHGFTLKCAIYGSLAGRLVRHVSRVNSVAGMGWVFTSDAFQARLLRPVVRALLKLALDGPKARLILQNPDDIALIRAAKLIDAHRMRLIPGSGVNCRRFKPRVDLETNENRGGVCNGDRFRVVLPARLLWDKGVAEFIEAARILKNAGRPVDFLLAGTPDPGNPAAVPEADLTHWVEEGLVSWLGHVDDMPLLFSTVDAVVLPSYREGLPKSLIEAAAAGLPLVTTDVPGCREVVTHQVNGLIVAAKDAVPLAAAIETLAMNPEMCRRFGLEARRIAIERYDERIVNAETVALYREVHPLYPSEDSFSKTAPENP